MKKQILKSTLLAMAGTAMVVGSAFAATIPGTWDGSSVESWLEQFVGAGNYTEINLISDGEIWASGDFIYSALASEAGNKILTKDPVASWAAADDVFNTANTTGGGKANAFGENAEVDFDSENLYFRDASDLDPANLAFDGYDIPTDITDSYFRIFQVIGAHSGFDTPSNEFSFLSEGGYVIGFNDNGSAPDKDYDDIIIGLRGGTLTAVPEPTTMLLFGTGLAGLAAVARRKRS